MFRSTVCSIFMGESVIRYEVPTRPWRWNRQCVPKHWDSNYRRRGIQNKTHDIHLSCSRSRLQSVTGHYFCVDKLQYRHTSKMLSLFIRPLVSPYWTGWLSGHSIFIKDVPDWNIGRNAGCRNCLSLFRPSCHQNAGLVLQIGLARFPTNTLQLNIH
jgi:hypothetical protein